MDLLQCIVCLAGHCHHTRWGLRHYCVPPTLSEGWGLDLKLEVTFSLVCSVSVVAWLALRTLPKVECLKFWYQRCVFLCHCAIASFSCVVDDIHELWSNSFHFSATSTKHANNNDNYKSQQDNTWPTLRTFKNTSRPAAAKFARCCAWPNGECLMLNAYCLLLHNVYLEDDSLVLHRLTSLLFGYAGTTHITQKHH